MWSLLSQRQGRNINRRMIIIHRQCLSFPILWLYKQSIRCDCLNLILRNLSWNLERTLQVNLATFNPIGPCSKKYRSCWWNRVEIRRVQVGCDCWFATVGKNAVHQEGNVPAEQFPIVVAHLLCRAQKQERLCLPPKRMELEHGIIALEQWSHHLILGFIGSRHRA